MAERIIVRQNNAFETEVLASDAHQTGPEALRPVEHLHGLTPYGMLLASLGSCTAILLHTYAQRHGLDLRVVELRLRYGRDFKSDCEDCDVNDRYEERIDLEIGLTGGLAADEREKLLLIAKQCPIHRLLKSGIEVRSQPVSD